MPSDDFAQLPSSFQPGLKHTGLQKPSIEIKKRGMPRFF
jgi:hypothetical protein